MIKDLIKYVPDCKKTAFIRDLYTCIQTKEVEKIVIESRIKHLYRAGYSKGQAVLSISNEFDKSKRSIYRYIKGVENGKD